MPARAGATRTLASMRMHARTYACTNSNDAMIMTGRPDPRADEFGSGGPAATGAARADIRESARGRRHGGHAEYITKSAPARGRAPASAAAGLRSPAAG